MHLDSNSIVLALGVLLGISEALAQIPSIKANSIFQAVQNVLKALNGSKPSGS